MRSDFFANEPGQRAVVVVGGGFEELRRSPDAGQRVLDFMGQHLSQARHRSRRATVRELSVHLLGDSPLLKQHDDAVRLFEHRACVDVDDAFAADTRRSDIHSVFVDCRAILPNLVDEREQWTAEGNELRQRAPAQHQYRCLEECFGGGVRLRDVSFPVDENDGMGQRIEEHFRPAYCGLLARTRESGVLGHAARSRSAAASLAIMRRTAVASFSVIRSARVAAALPSVRPCRSQYQPRCLRATRTPKIGP